MAVNKHAELRFWVLWTNGTILTGFAGGYLSFRFEDFESGMLILGAVLVGSVQWFVLRKYIQLSWMWALTTGGSVFVLLRLLDPEFVMSYSTLIDSLPGRLTGETFTLLHAQEVISNDSLHFRIASISFALSSIFTLFGGLLGVSQWLLLRDKFARAWRWLFVNIGVMILIGFIITFSTITLVLTVVNAMGLFLGFPLALILLGLISGFSVILYSAITGLAMARLLRNPKTHQPVITASNNPESP